MVLIEPRYSPLKYKLTARPWFQTTDQGISELGKVPFEILPEKRHIAWVSAVVLFSNEFQSELTAPYVIRYCTSP